MAGNDVRWWAGLLMACGIALAACSGSPRVNLLHRGRARRNLLTVVAYVAIAIAVLPGVLPLDHMTAAHDDSPAEQQVHASHCHESPGTCSDLPLLSGPGQFLAPEPLILAPAQVSVLLPVSAAALAGRTDAPETRPPRRGQSAISG